MQTDQNVYGAKWIWTCDLNCIDCSKVIPTDHDVNDNVRFLFESLMSSQWFFVIELKMNTVSFIRVHKKDHCNQ